MPDPFPFQKFSAVRESQLARATPLLLSVNTSMASPIKNLRTFLVCLSLSGASCAHGIFPLPQEASPVVQDVKPTGGAGPVTKPAVPVLKVPREVFPAESEVASGYTTTYDNAFLEEDVVWHGRVLIRGAVTVASQATLTVSPGTVIVLVPDRDGAAEGALLIRGRLVVDGTAERPVIFRPDSRQVASGGWQGLLLLGSGKNNRIEHARIYGARIGVDAVFSTATLRSVMLEACLTGGRFQGSLVTVDGGGAANCDVGYQLVDSESVLRDVVVTGNGRGLTVSGGSLLLKSAVVSGNSGAAMVAERSVLNLEHSTFAKNGAGLSLTDCEGGVTSSLLVENYDYGLLLKNSRVRVFDNLLSRNTGVAISVENGSSSAWGNSFSQNGLYAVYNAGAADFNAMGNWWGETQSKDLHKRLFDRANDPHRGVIRVSPALGREPNLNLPGR
jgi:hypothetical protein